MDLEALQHNWDQFGRNDPMWAILTRSDRQDRQWDPAEFFAMGHRHVLQVLDRLHALGYRPGCGRALDFGCGIGRLSQALCPHFDHVLGLDIAPSMIAQAERWNRFPSKCSYRANPAADLSSLETASFDFVISLLTLQHMRPEFSSAYIREFFRVVKPGGCVVFQAPFLTTVPADATPMPPSAYQAEIQVDNLPPAAPAGSLLTLSVWIRNRGEQPWPGGPGATTALCLGNHWLDSSARPFRWDDARLPLPRWLAPGDALMTAFQVRVPSEPGRFLLEFDLVHEQVCWFADRGTPALRMTIDVAPRPADALPEPVIEMYGRPPSEVVALIEDAGGELIEIGQDDNTAAPWLSYRYCARRRW